MERNHSALGGYVTFCLFLTERSKTKPRVECRGNLVCTFGRGVYSPCLPRIKAPLRTLVVVAGFDEGMRGQGCIRGEQGVGEGFWWEEVGRGCFKNPHPRLAAGRKAQKKISRLSCGGNFATECQRDLSAKNRTENLCAGSRIGRGGGRERRGFRPSSGGCQLSNTYLFGLMTASASEPVTM